MINFIIWQARGRNKATDEFKWFLEVRVDVWRQYVMKWKLTLYTTRRTVTKAVSVGRMTKHDMEFPDVYACILFMFVDRFNKITLSIWNERTSLKTHTEK